jgi:hypothetical protein
VVRPQASLSHKKAQRAHKAQKKDRVEINDRSELKTPFVPSVLFVLFVASLWLNILVAEIV